MPVIQARVAQFLVVGGEAHGPHQVQRRPGDGAGAGDVPRVLGDLRLYEHNVQLGQNGTSLSQKMNHAQAPGGLFFSRGPA